MNNNTLVDGGDFRFSLFSVGGRWAWSVRTDNVDGYGQSYQVVNIDTPYGRLYTVEIPIPGDVVLSMAQSLLTVQQQLAPLLIVPSPNPPIINLTLTEGDTVSSAGTVLVQNSGAFGSFMSVNATQDVPWLSVSPASINSIAFSKTGKFDLTINPCLLFSSESPYVGHINLQDNRNPPTVIPVTVNVTVLPRPVIGVDTDSLMFNFVMLTSAPSGAQTVCISNTGLSGSSLDCEIFLVFNSNWLCISHEHVWQLEPNREFTLTLSLKREHIPYTPNTYTDTLRIRSKNAINKYVDIPVQLTVA